MQTHLDLGQRNFYSTRCRTCGLVYTPGKDEDDRLHAAYHKNLHALRYTPAAADTAVTKDGSKGSIVRLAPAAGKSKTVRQSTGTLSSRSFVP